MTNWLQKIGNSPFGIILGLLLIIVTLGLLFSNESKFDPNQLANKAESISTNQNYSNQYDRLVAVTGKLGSTKKLNDNLLLKDGNYLAINRTVEIFSDSTEIYQDNSSKELNCSLGWIPITNENNSTINNKSKCPVVLQELESKEFINKDIRLGDYFFDFNQTGLPDYTTLQLESEILDLSALNKTTTSPEESSDANSQSQPKIDPIIEQNYIFIGTGTFEVPNNGDIRISYQVIFENQTATIFGKIQGTAIIPYKHQDGQIFYTLRSGDYPEALLSFTNNNNNLWVYRILSYILFWLALIILLSPIQGTLNLIPVIGNLSKNFFVVFCLLVSFFLTIFTVYFTAILNNLFLLILLTFVTGGSILVLSYKGANKISKNNSFKYNSQPIDRHKIIDRQRTKVSSSVAKKEKTKSIKKSRTRKSKDLPL